MDSCVPLPLEHDKLMDLVDKAKDYCLMHGICMRQKDRDCNRICWGLIHPPIMNTNVLLMSFIDSHDEEQALFSIAQAAAQPDQLPK